MPRWFSSAPALVAASVKRSGLYWVPVCAARMRVPGYKVSMLYVLYIMNKLRNVKKSTTFRVIATLIFSKSGASGVAHELSPLQAVYISYIGSIVESSGDLGCSRHTVVMFFHVESSPGRVVIIGIRHYAKRGPPQKMQICCGSELRWTLDIDAHCRRSGNPPRTPHA